MRAWGSLVATACAFALGIAGLVVAPAGSGLPSGPVESSGVKVPRRLTVVQLNLCLHQRHLGRCYDRPGSGGPRTPRAKRDEAVRIIERIRPDSVTLNEVCSRDVRRIARRTGYERRFTTTERRGARCSERRGRFGIALLARRFHGPRVERWSYNDVSVPGRWGMCARTAGDVLLCTSHLEPGSPGAQCGKLRRKLSRRRLPVVFGGDVNRRGDRPACRGRRSWVRRDFMADQIPGVQHVYGTATAFRPVGAQGSVRHLSSTDHSAFVVGMRRR